MGAEIVAGLVLLAIGGEGLVRGGVNIARRLGLSALFVGVVFVSIGTSAPELVVSVGAIQAGQPDIAVGNVIGSNISNVFLVLAFGALIFPIAIQRNIVYRDGVVLLAASGLLVYLAFQGPLTPTTGAFLVAALVVFVVISYFSERGAPAISGGGQSGFLNENLVVNILILGGGVIALMLGAQYLISGSVDLARDLGVSEAVIGLSLVAVGTSLPELAATVVAALRRHPEVVAGNIIGSGIFNILGIIGVSALVAPTPIEFPQSVLMLDVWVMLAAACVIVPFFVSNWRLTRIEGALMLAVYVAYMSLLFGYWSLPLL
jgi:cation:H+ antiporter